MHLFSARASCRFWSSTAAWELQLRNYPRHKIHWVRSTLRKAFGGVVSSASIWAKSDTHLSKFALVLWLLTVDLQPAPPGSCWENTSAVSPPESFYFCLVSGESFTCPSDLISICLHAICTHQYAADFFVLKHLLLKLQNWFSRPRHLRYWMFINI